MKKTLYTLPGEKQISEIGINAEMATGQYDFIIGKHIRRGQIKKLRKITEEIRDSHSLEVEEIVRQSNCLMVSPNG